MVSLKYLFNVIFSISCLTFNPGNAQNILISTSANEIFQLDEDLSLTLLSQIENLSRPMSDIAVGPENTIYGISGKSLIVLDIVNDDYTLISELPGSDLDYTSLVSNEVGQLFTLNNSDKNIYRYDSNSGSIDIIGNVGFYTPGDLTFYQGKLAIVNFPYLTAYNLTNQELTNIFCIPELGGLIWGLTNVFEDCSEQRIIASNLGNELWEFDIDTGETHVIDFQNVLSSTIYGLASYTEMFAANCNGSLISVECNLSNPHNDYEDYTLYPNPTNGILYLKKAHLIERVEVYNIQGQLKISSNLVHNKYIDISNLETGLYLVKIYYANKLISEKIIKK